MPHPGVCSFPSSPSQSGKRPVIAVWILLCLLPAVHTAALSLDPPDKPEWMVFPIVFYTPQTSVTLGLMGMHVIPQLSDKTINAPSSLRMVVMATFNQQLIIRLSPTFYFQGGRWSIRGRWTGQVFPDKFHGLGNHAPADQEEAFTSRGIKGETLFSFRPLPALELGLRQEFLLDNPTDFTAGGLLASGTVPGTGEVRLSALGLTLIWDSRDNRMSPHSGHYLSLTSAWFDPILGSSHQYRKLQADLRGYVSPAPNHVFAMQVHFQTIQGTVPFQGMSSLGGPFLLRGYVRNRFRDQHALLFQADWRFGLIGPLRCTLSAACGQVAGRPALIAWNQLHWSSGVGLRYRLHKKRRVDARLDIAYGFGETEPKVYMGMLEAF